MKTPKLAAIYLLGPAVFLFMLPAVPSPRAAVPSVKTASDGLVLEKEQVLKIMERVADWQIGHQAEVIHHDLDWTNAALYIGLAELAAISQDPKYQQWLIDLGGKYRF